MSTPCGAEARESVQKKNGGRVKETDRCKCALQSPAAFFSLLTIVHHHFPEQVLDKCFLKTESYAVGERRRTENWMGAGKETHSEGNREKIEILRKRETFSDKKV